MTTELRCRICGGLVEKFVASEERDAGTIITVECHGETDNRVLPADAEPNTIVMFF